MLIFTNFKLEKKVRPGPVSNPQTVRDTGPQAGALDLKAILSTGERDNLLFINLLSNQQLCFEWLCCVIVIEVNTF